MWGALQHAAWVETLATSRLLFGLALVAHYVSTFVCVGSAVLLNLRLLGGAHHGGELSSLRDALQPWTWAACGLLAISGFLLFTVLANSYVVATPFRLKMLVVALAVLSALTIQWRVPAWERTPVLPATARVAAVISLVLWLGALLQSVEIPALTGLG